MRTPFPPNRPSPSRTSTWRGCRLGGFAAFLLFALTVRSAAAELPPRRSLGRLGLEQGLSHTDVYAVLQDRQGFLWFGTQDGLDRYDGREIVGFTAEAGAQGGLPGSDISALLEDRDGALWVAVWSHGLVRLDPRTGQFAPPAGSNGEVPRVLRDRIQTLFQDGAGAIWIGTYSDGLARLNPLSGTVTTYRPDPAGATAISDQRVWAVCEDPDGSLWVATGRGLDRLDRASGRFTRVLGEPPGGGDAPHPRALLVGGGGALWVGTERGLYALDRRAGRLRPIAGLSGPATAALRDEPVNALIQDRLGRLWVGLARSGLCCIDLATGETAIWGKAPERLDSLVQDDVRALWEDRSGVLWIGMRGGGVQSLDVRPDRFERVAPEALPDRAVWTLHVDRDGTLWAGTQAGLSRRGAGETSFRTFRRIPGDPRTLPDDNVNVLGEDLRGRLWVGTWGGGLCRLHRETGECDLVTPVESAPGDAKITALAAASDGGLWVCSRAGLSRVDPGGSRLVPVLRSDRKECEVLLDDPAGPLWIGTDGGGLLEYDPGTGTTVRHPAGPAGLSDPSVRSLWRDAGRNVLWIGTSNGLDALDRRTGRITSYLEKDGLPNGCIHAIREDGSGRLWLSTNRGLSRFAPESGRFRNYTTSDGLQGAVFSSASAAGPDGRLYFGGNNGLNAFYPDRVTDSPTPPPVVLTRIDLFARPLALDRPLASLDEIVLSHRDTLVSFEFAALDFADLSRNRYAYRLEGFDPGWIDSGQRGFASYTNLDAGHYRFRVKAANSDQVWNEAGASIAVHVLPPPWKTWWAYTVYVLLLGGAVATFVRVQQRKVERERAVSARLRQADRLKDEFLANTSHELRTPLTGIIGLADSLIAGVTGALPEKAVHDLSMIVGSARRLANLVNDILDFSRLRNRDLSLKLGAVDLHALSDVVLTLSRPLVGNKPLELRNEVPVGLPPARADENRIEQVLHNLVGNAIKFTDAGTVTVSARADATGLLEVSVIDTGVGIPAGALERIFESFEQGDGSIERRYGGTGLGLAITRQLVALHGGTISVESAEGSGSCFTFTLPVADEPAGTFSSAGTALEVTGVLDPEAAVPLAVADASRKGDGYRILVVDDEPVNLQVLANYLSLADYSITAASDGRQALALLDGGPAFDLVILDVMMPGMSGYEVCKRLRERYPPNRLPVVLLTAKRQVSDLVAGFDAGANDYLMKPFSRSELLSRIDTHLKLLRANTAMWRFVPHAFLQTLGHESVLDASLGDQMEAEMTVLFADIRAYTSLAESMTPRDNFAFINAYLSRVGPVIEAHGGFVNQYYGDGIMALFGGAADGAVAAAVEMQQTVAAYNRERVRHGRRPIRIGVGVHTGPLILGIIGDDRRMDTGVIADAVNTAARMEGLTKHFGASIVVSGGTLDRVGDPGRFPYRSLGRARVKGKVRDVSVYEVYGGDTPAAIAARQRTSADFAQGLRHYLDARPELAVTCFERVLAIDTDDRPALLYHRRAQSLAVTGVPAGWTGVEAVDAK